MSITPSELKLKAFLQSEHATLPKRGSALAAGFDLSSAVDAIVPSRGRACISTGVVVSIPQGHYGRIASRSGLALNKGIDVGAGVIDRDYRSTVGVVLFNHGIEDFHVKVGDRIAQLILTKISECDVEQVLSIDDLSKTERGEGGFGSTGLSAVVLTASSSPSITDENKESITKADNETNNIKLDDSTSPDSTTTSAASSVDDVVEGNLLKKRKLEE